MVREVLALLLTESFFLFALRLTRLCADALVAAERRIDARIVDRLDDGMRDRLDALLTESADGSVTRFVWLRQFEVGRNSADMNRLLDR